MTALALDPAETKLACYGYSTAERSSNKVGYIFVLDAETGTPVSGLMKMSHSREFTASSSGILLNDDGHVFMTKSTLKYGSESDYA